MCAGCWCVPCIMDGVLAASCARLMLGTNARLAASTSVDATIPCGFKRGPITVSPFSLEGDPCGQRPSPALRPACISGTRSVRGERSVTRRSTRIRSTDALVLIMPQPDEQVEHQPGWAHEPDRG